ncbi:MAG: methyltransferase domain-containing protein [Thermomicrobiales bacterium]|nr:methyltransferase domain-containing protein [Thermomicrobiales bacterium]
MATEDAHLTAERVARVKRSMQRAWNLPGAGYAEMAETLRPAVDHLIDVAGISPGARVLDAATGTGIAAIAAARRGAEVIGVDFAADLLAGAREQAASQRLPDIQFDLADIEELPYPDGAFDVVISSFGAIFAPQHSVVGRELCRVLRPGGRLAFTAWLNESPNCHLMTLTAPYTPPPPAGSDSVFDWSDIVHLRSMIGPWVDSIAIQDGDVPWLAPSLPDACDFLFHRALGPTMYVFQRLEIAQQLALHNDAIALLAGYLHSDGTVRVPRAYVVVAATRAENAR